MVGTILIATTILLACIALISWISYKVHDELQFRPWSKDLGRWEDDGNTED